MQWQTLQEFFGGREIMPVALCLAWVVYQHRQSQTLALPYIQLYRTLV